MNLLPKSAVEQIIIKRPYGSFFYFYICISFWQIGGGELGESNDIYFYRKNAKKTGIFGLWMYMS